MANYSVHVNTSVMKTAFVKKIGSSKPKNLKRQSNSNQVVTRPLQIEHFLCIPYGLRQGTHYRNRLALGQPGLSEHQHSDWTQNTGGCTLLAKGLVVPMSAWAYRTEPYERVNPKAIFSQVNSSLGPWLCKANTKEVDVQVSPVDRSVQCLLGPLTLHGCSPWGCKGPKAPLPAWDLHSPVTGLRGLVRLWEDGKNEKRKAPSDPAEASQQQQKSPPTPGSQQDKRVELCPQDLLVGRCRCPGERQSQQAQGDQPLRKPDFQFLEQKYGYLNYKEYETRWESAYVGCTSGTSKVYFKQLCCKCHKSFHPYQVEAIWHQTCSKSHCFCPKKRHIDIRRPHQQELYGHCKKRFSCGNIYGIKYIL
ncbi:LOW QUALITY PROTEIN: protein ZAR1-like [Rhynchonycteris naso]